MENLLQIIKKDCDELEKKGDLTEYGNGQLALINIISGKLETK